MTQSRLSRRTLGLWAAGMALGSPLQALGQNAFPQPGQPHHQADRPVREGILRAHPGRGQDGRRREALGEMAARNHASSLVTAVARAACGMVWPLICERCRVRNWSGGNASRRCMVVKLFQSTTSPRRQW